MLFFILLGLVFAQDNSTAGLKFCYKLIKQGETVVGYESKKRTGEDCTDAEYTEKDKPNLGDSYFCQQLVNAKQCKTNEEECDAGSTCHKVNA